MKLIYVCSLLANKKKIQCLDIIINVDAKLERKQSGPSFPPNSVAHKFSACV